MFDDELFLNINIYLLKSRPRHNLEVEEEVDMKVEVVVVDMREVGAVADGLLLVVVVVDLVAEVEEGAQVVVEGDHLTRSDGR